MNEHPIRIIADTGDDSRPPAFSDEALALRFAELHADDLRFVAACGKWLSWTGANHLNGITTLEEFDPALYRRLAKAE